MHTTSASLGLQFVNDTPIVDNAVIRAEFKANRSVSRINCQLLGQHSTPKDCKQTVSFMYVSYLRTFCDLEVTTVLNIKQTASFPGFNLPHILWSGNEATNST